VRSHCFCGSSKAILSLQSVGKPMNSEKSDEIIVVMKLGNAGGAKGLKC
jgi:hypothetical protein